MLLRLNDQWSSQLLGSLILLTVLFFCGHSTAKGPPQPLHKCDNITRVNGSEELILYYVERSIPNDTACTRYAWSTVGYPTLFISQDRSSCQCSYDIDETEYVSNQTHGSVNITGTDSYFSLAIVFTRLIEFQVDSKKAESFSGFNVTNACDSEREYVDGFKSVTLSSEELHWRLSDDNKLSDDKKLVANLTSENSTQVLVTIKTHFPDQFGFKRLNTFPKPKISENATLVEFTVHNISNETDRSGGAGRLALEMFIVHGSKVNNGTVNQIKYLDDEYTPSIFSSWTYNVSGNMTDFDDLGGYFHWKPISYQDSSRKSTTSQQVNVVSAGNTSECQLHTLPRGLATALFGEDVNPVSVSNVTRWFAVFGTDGDDNYLNPTYSTWTVVVGYGEVPSDSLSFTVIITIIVGLGVPGALVIVGGVYVFIKKKPWQGVSRLLAKARGRSGYTPL